MPEKATSLVGDGSKPGEEGRLVNCADPIYSFSNSRRLYAVFQSKSKLFDSSESVKCNFMVVMLRYRFAEFVKDAV